MLGQQARPLHRGAALYPMRSTARAAAVAVHTRHPPQSWKLVGPNGLAQKCQLNGALCPLEPTQHEDEPGSPSRRRSQVSTSSRNRLRAVDLVSPLEQRLSSGGLATRAQSESAGSRALPTPFKGPILRRARKWVCR